jgi:hypothetical protein
MEPLVETKPPAAEIEIAPKIEKSKQNRKISGILFGGFGGKVYFCSRN